MPSGRKPGTTYTKWSSYNKDNIIKRFRKKYLVDINTGCWLWLGKPNQGYGGFYMKGKTYPAHRASYILFIKDVPDDLLVCHTCNNKMCVNPEHLYVGIHIDNMRDLRKSKVLAGKNNPNYGVKCSDKKRRKLSKSNSNAWKNPKVRKKYIKAFSKRKPR